MAFLTILADSVVVPSSNPTLFLPLFLLIALLNGALLLWNYLGVQPLSAAAADDYNKLSVLDPKTQAYALQLNALLSDLAKLTAVGLTYLVASLVVGFGLRIITFYSALDALRARGLHEAITFPDVLRRAGGSLKGPVLTQLLVYLFQFGYVVVFLLLGGLLTLAIRSAWIFLVILVFFLTILFFIYLSFVFSVSLVVSVDHADVYGYAAVRRAWGLVARNKWLGIALVVFFAVLSSILSFLYTKIAGVSVVAQVALWAVSLVVAAVVEVVSATAIAVYYDVCNARARDAGELYDPLPPAAV